MVGGLYAKSVLPWSSDLFSEFAILLDDKGAMSYRLCNGDGSLDEGTGLSTQLESPWPGEVHYRKAYPNIEGTYHECWKLSTSPAGFEIIT